MELTPLGFKKPISSDSADLRVFVGENMDLLDLKLQTKADLLDLETKVSAVAGKGLSTNDFTTAEKDKLANLVVGAQGQNGKSAYQIWLDAGNTGTAQQFLDSLKGEQGIQGIQGIQGLKGDQGSNGIGEGGGSGAIFEDLVFGEVVMISPPLDVTNPVYTNLKVSSVTLSWTPSTSEIKDYKVYNGSTLIGAVTSATLDISNLVHSTAYAFTIKARNRFDVESIGVNVFLTTPSPDIVPPTNVSGLAASNIKSISLSLTWEQSVSADTVGYDVWVTSPTNSYLGTTSNTTYSISDLTQSTSYTFSVRAKDETGNIATGTILTVSTIAPTILVSDNFNRADQSGLGTSSSGHTWLNTTNTSIVSNQAKATLGASGMPVIDTTKSDLIKISADLYLPSSSLSTHAITFRYVDNNNYLKLSREGNSVRLYKVVSNTTTQVGQTYSIPSPSYPSTTSMSASMIGTTIICYFNGTEIIRQSITENQAATKCGIHAYFSGVEHRFDNFKVEAL